MLSPDPNFLEHYFHSIYNKLEADALLFNRKLPHAGLVGSENEKVLSSLLRDFLPIKFGIETGGIIVDRHGRVSKQCDIVIFDAESPKFFHKVFPVETVYATIEVKTTLTSKEALIALKNIRSIFELDFYPELVPYWKAQTEEKKLYHYPPTSAIFAYRTEANSFETFAKWFLLEEFRKDVGISPQKSNNFEIRSLTVCALDQGLIKMESTNAFVERWAAVARQNEANRTFDSQVRGAKVQIDPAQSLLLFLTTLWQRLSTHRLHPGFDIRTYMSLQQASVVEVPDV
jgi:hypothetical protein